MNKRNTWLGIGAVVIVAAIVIFALVHKSNDKNTPASSSTTSTVKAPPGSSQKTSTDIVTTKNNTTNGEYLADSTGKPLYTYSADTSGVSNCTGSCLESWPLYGPVSTPASMPANVTIISRSDGRAQYAYKGMPLYYFASDSSDVPTGDGVGGFNLAKP